MKLIGYLGETTNAMCGNVFENSNLKDSELLDDNIKIDLRENYFEVESWNWCRIVSNGPIWY
jgi:hypothetical protein